MYNLNDKYNILYLTTYNTYSIVPTFVKVFNKFNYIVDFFIKKMYEVDTKTINRIC